MQQLTTFNVEEVKEEAEMSEESEGDGEGESTVCLIVCVKWSQIQYSINKQKVSRLDNTENQPLK